MDQGRFARELLRHIEAWKTQGVVDEETTARLRSVYEPAARREPSAPDPDASPEASEDPGELTDGSSAAVAVLYALAGALVAAAVLVSIQAFGGLGETFLGPFLLGLVFLGAGLAWSVLGDRTDVADAAAVTGLVLLSVAAPFGRIFDAAGFWAPFVVAAACAVIVIRRRSRFLVPVATITLLVAGVGGALALEEATGIAWPYLWLVVHGLGASILVGLWELEGRAPRVMSLFALATVGIGVGAAVDGDPRGLVLAASAVTCGVVAWRLGYRDRGPAGFAQGLWLASLAPLGLVSSPLTSWSTGWAALGAVAPLALLLARHEDRWVANLGPAGAVAVHVAVAISWADVTEMSTSQVLAGLTLAVLAVTVLVNVVREREAVLGGCLATLGFGFSAGALLESTFDWSSTTSLGVLGIVLGLVAAAGSLLRQRGVTATASLLLGIDAIVFAFELGGVLMGAVVLIGLAVATVLGADRLREYIPSP